MAKVLGSYINLLPIAKDSFLEEARGETCMRSFFKAEPPIGRIKRYWLFKNILSLLSVLASFSSLELIEEDAIILEAEY